MPNSIPQKKANKIDDVLEKFVDMIYINEITNTHSDFAKYNKRLDYIKARLLRIIILSMPKKKILSFEGTFQQGWEFAILKCKEEGSTICVAAPTGIPVFVGYGTKSCIFLRQAVKGGINGLFFRADKSYLHLSLLQSKYLRP